MKPNYQVRSFATNFKRLLFIVLPVLMIISGSSFSSRNFSDPGLNNLKPSPVKIKVIIDIGRKSRDCRGLGICDVTIEIELKAINASNQVATDASNNKGNLTLDIDESALSKETKDAYFSGDIFVVEESYTLRDEVASVLGFPVGYRIAAGKYPINKQAGVYQVVFAAR